MSFKSVFQDVRNAVDFVHMQVGSDINKNKINFQLVDNKLEAHDDEPFNVFVKYTG